jgi:type III secretion protein V
MDKASGSEKLKTLGQLALMIPVLSEEHRVGWTKMSEAGLAVFVLTIAIALVVPLPTPLLDILLSANLGASLLLLLISLQLPSALALLTFPSILVLSTLLRLSLNVASCRLILSTGDAGEVIHAFGTFLIQGEIVVGFIIFFILTSVNLIVISRGASRVSEVAARFALEGLAGNQSAIDSDLRSGLLTPEQAHQRREQLRQESQLYGAMDGAMRFVQGDGVAGVFIIVANLIGGLYIGLSRGLDLSSAVRHYSILTVGDGLVTQIPALMTAICAGLLVTRVEGETELPLSRQLSKQIFARPMILVMSGVVLLSMAVIPGLPMLPFSVVGGAFVLCGSLLLRRSRRTGGDMPGDGVFRMVPGPKDRDVFAGPNRSVCIRLDPSRLGAALRDKEAFYQQRWAQCSLEGFSAFGTRLPRLVIEEDPGLAPGEYRILLRGDEIFRGFLNPDSVFVELGVENSELFGFSVIREERHPVTDKIVFWSPIGSKTLTIAQAGEVRLLDCIEFLFVKLIVFFRHHPEEVLGILDVHVMLKELDRRFPGTIEETLQRNMIDATRMTELIHELVREGLDVSDFSSVVEAVLAYCASYRFLFSQGGDLDVGHAAAHIRVQRRRSVVAGLLNNRRVLRAFELSSEVEEYFERIPMEVGSGPLSVPSQVKDPLLRGLRLLFDPIGRYGMSQMCIVCRPDLRGRIARFLRSSGVQCKTLSREEVDSSIPVERVALWRAIG